MVINVHELLVEIKDKITNLEKSIKLKNDNELLKILVYDYLENGSIEDRDLFIKMINYDVALTVKGHQKFSNDLEIAKLVNSKDPNYNCYFADEILNKEDKMFKVFLEEVKEFINKTKFNNLIYSMSATVPDKKLLLKMIKFNPLLIYKGHPKFKDDLEIAKMIVKHDVLVLFDEKERTDEASLIDERIELLFNYFSNGVKEQLVNDDLTLSDFLIDGTLENKELFIKMVNYNYKYICKGYPGLFSELEIAELIFEKDPTAILNLIYNKSIENKNFLIKLIKYNPGLIYKGYDYFKNDIELAKLIREENKCFLGYFTDEVRQDLEEEFNNYDVIVDGTVTDKELFIKIINSDSKYICKGHHTLYNDLEISKLILEKNPKFIVNFSDQLIEKLFEKNKEIVYNIDNGTITNKNFLIKLIKYDTELIYKGHQIFFNDLEIGKIVASSYPNYIDYFSEETREKIIGDDLRLGYIIKNGSVKNKNFLIKLINYNPVFIVKGDPKIFSSDIDIALLINSKNSIYLNYFSKETVEKVNKIKDDLIELLKKDGMCLKDANDIFRKDIVMINIAIDQNPKAIEFSLNDRLIYNKKTMLRLVEEDGKYLQYASDSLKEDFEIAFTSVSNCKEAINYVSPKLKDKINYLFS